MARHAVGIRREDKSRWERRVPLVPEDVSRLEAEHDVEVIVQPSPIRVFEDSDYEAVGASINEDLSSAGVILAVKEVPMEKLLPNRCYGFFAHVIKGQPYNMPLLRHILDSRITLVDYERVTNENDRRLVKFGLQAGQAGMIDSFWALGQRLEREGFQTPFSDVEPAHHYADLADAQRALTSIGRQLLEGAALPEPIVVGFTGRGSVTSGALDVFDLLPHTQVTPEELPEVLKRPERDRLFKVMFEKRHLARPRDQGEFDEALYRHRPELFEDRLYEFLPHLTMLINGIYWTDKYPRFVSKKHVQDLWNRGERRLRIIGDITCDIDGAIELTYKATQPDAPTYVYDPENDSFVDGFDGPGVCVLAVDNLPCELPRDASMHFSRHLREMVPLLADADFGLPFEDLHLPPEIKRAVITHRGELTPDYRYLQPIVDEVAPASGQGAVAE